MSFKCAEQFVKEMKSNPNLREKISKLKNIESLKDVLDLKGFDFNQCDLTKAMAACMDEMSKSTGANAQKNTTADAKLDKKTQALIAIGAATAANCIPCFEHLYYEAGTLKIADDQIQAAVDIASKVKTGASLAIKDAIKDLMSGEVEAGQKECCMADASCC